MALHEVVWVAFGSLAERGRLLHSKSDLFSARKTCHDVRMATRDRSEGLVRLLRCEAVTSAGVTGKVRFATMSLNAANMWRPMSALQGHTGMKNALLALVAVAA